MFFVILVLFIDLMVILFTCYTFSDLKETVNLLENRISNVMNTSAQNSLQVSSLQNVMIPSLNMYQGKNTYDVLILFIKE